jgi:hypothetical protein
MDLRYVGRKPIKADSVARTGIVWNGHGDIQSVPDDKAGLFLEHPDIWEPVGAMPAGVPTLTATLAPTPAPTLAPTPAPTPAPAAVDDDKTPEQGRKHLTVVAPQSDSDSLFRIRDEDTDDIIDLNSLDERGLKALCRENGIPVDLRSRGDAFRAAIVTAVAAAAQ